MYTVSQSRESHRDLPDSLESQIVKDSGVQNVPQRKNKPGNYFYMINDTHRMCLQYSGLYNLD